MDKLILKDNPVFRISFAVEHYCLSGQSSYGHQVAYAHMAREGKLGFEP